MLQQTQVKTVIPYWERWMRELPTLAAAAQASPAKLHKLWEGLGYYTRVRNLQRAAQQVVVQHDGRFPEDFDAILALPGIGRYTAGAICSIAFNQPKPILDGNVIRVLTRVFGITADPREKKTNTRLWQLAEGLILHASHITHHASPCSHLNQSLMELGALICTPRSPNCAACSVNRLCIARRQGLQEQLPKLAKPIKPTSRRFLAFIVERNGKLLVRQRPAGVVNAHLWEFPNVEVGAATGRARHSVRAAAPQSTNGARRTDAPYQQSDFLLSATRPVCVIKHSITRYRITLEAWRAQLADSSTGITGHWLTPNQLHRLAFTSAHKRILDAVSANASLRKRS